MSTYIGYYWSDEDFRRENAAKARESGTFYQNPTMRDKVVGLRDNLPEGLTLIGSYGPLAGGSREHPSVWICETDDPQKLDFVSRWYSGFLEFDWRPARAIGTTSATTADTMDARTGRD